MDRSHKTLQFDALSSPGLDYFAEMDLLDVGE